MNTIDNFDTVAETETRLIEALMGHNTLELEHDDRIIAEYPINSKRVIGQSQYRLAKIYYDKADLLKAESYFLKASQECELPRDGFPLFKIYGFLIRIYSEGLNQEEAITYIEKSEELLENLAVNLGTLTAEYFYNMGVVKTYRSDFAEAKTNFMLAHKKAQEENEPEILAKSLYALATNFNSMGDSKQALSYLDQLKELLAILKKAYLFGNMHILYANVYSELGQYQKAEEHYNIAISTLQHKKCWNLFSYVLLNKASLYKKLGDFNKSLMNLELAQITLDKENFKRLAGLVENAFLDLNDSSVDIYLDRQNRVVSEKLLGTIDFKHRFVLLEILFLLAKNPGIYFDKEDLAKHIWKDEYNPLIHDKLIYTSVSRLRKLIEPKNGKRQYIIRGKDGYTFNPNVKTRFHKENERISYKSIGNVEISSPV
ncbi:MAG: winged helix-turn-helix domain-containing protein [Bacteriovoracaceae bacterium]